MTDVALPGDAVRRDGGDIVGPTTATLEALFLLPSERDLAQAGGPAAVLSGPPQSVAVIESTATALAKWWSVALAGTGAAAWTGIVTFWNNNEDPTRRVVLWAAALVTAALVLALGYVIGSDVRGRADAAVATINARRHVAAEMIRAVASLGPADGAGEPAAITPIPAQQVAYIARPASDEEGWTALAMRPNGDGTAPSAEYLVVKGEQSAWAHGNVLRFR